MRTGSISLVLALVVALMLAPGALAAPTTFTVGGTGDGGDANIADGLCAAAGGTCTLRAAIEQSNVSSGGAPYTIDLSGIPGQTIQPASVLPAITRDSTFVDGCGVGRTTAGGLPKEPASDPCVGLRDVSSLPTGIVVRDAQRAYVQGLAVTGFDVGVRLWGSDSARVRGNWLGLRVTTGSLEANGTAVKVTGRTQDGALVDPSKGNYVGDASSAADASFAVCDRSCNVIVGSSVAGVDLVGATSPSGPGDAPAGGDPGDLLDGTSIQGNWIGVATPSGLPPLPNAVAVRIGAATQTMIGGDEVEQGNVISGNAAGVDQGTGTGVTWLVHGVYGLSPDQESTILNGQWNARLGGGPVAGVTVEHALFGPSEVGLDLEGPKADVRGNSFFSPDSERFDTAAIRVGPGADRAFIGSAAGPAPACAPLLDNCNGITYTGPGAPGILVDGADDARIQRNAIGGGALFSPPLDGPPIRFDNGAHGGLVGDDDDNPDARNVLTRTAYPAVEIRGGASGVVVAGNEGIAVGAFSSPSAIFTDLLPAPGPGNTGPANGGIQPPVITQATTQGVGGTALPGATIHILQQQRKKVTGQDDPFPYGEGYTFPTTPSVVTADENGVWGVTFPSTALLLPGQKLLASQTTAAGSSEYASPAATGEGNPPVIVTINGGPSGVVGERSASFTFTASRAVRRFECSVDAGAFVPCASPFTLNALDIGGHQLRVRGVDPTDTAGNIASRNWIIVVPEPVNQTPPDGGASAAALRFSSLVTLPSARKCVSRRSLKLRVRAPAGTRILKAVARVRGRTVGSTRRSGSLSVSLKGLPRGSFKVTVTVAYADGRQVTGTRTYRTCAKKKSKKPRRR